MNNDVKIVLTPEESAALARVKSDYLLNPKSYAYYYMWVGILALRGYGRLPQFSFQLPKYIDDNVYLYVSNNEVAVCRCNTNNISGVINGIAYCEDCELPKAN